MGDLKTMKPPLELPFTNDEAEKSIRQFGLLSPVVAAAPPAFRQENEGWFELVDELNAIAQRLIAWISDQVPGRRTLDPIPVGARVFIRIVQGFQAAVILTERGITAEAESLARNCYEATFWLGYIAKSGEEAVRAFENEQRASELQEMRFIEKAIERQPDLVDDAFTAKVKIRINELRPSVTPKVGIEELSRRAGLANDFIYYKRLSSGSAHTSVASVHRHLWRDSDGDYLGHVLGPDGDGIPRVLAVACNALWLACDALHSLAGPSPELGALSALDPRFQRQIDGLFPIHEAGGGGD